MANPYIALGPALQPMRMRTLGFLELPQGCGRSNPEAVRKGSMTSTGSRTDKFPDVMGRSPFGQVLAGAVVQVTRLLAAMSYSNSGTGVFGGSPPRNLIASSTAPLSISMRQSADIDPMWQVRMQLSIPVSGPL